MRAIRKPSPQTRAVLTTLAGLTALRTGWSRGPSFVAAGTFAGYAAITPIASRTMLANERTGILAGVLISVPILLAIGTIAARAGRSFRTGLEYGVIALVASLAGTLAIASPKPSPGTARPASSSSTATLHRMASPARPTRSVMR